jgi:ABC-2 type transport system permease protein
MACAPSGLICIRIASRRKETKLDRYKTARRSLIMNKTFIVASREFKERVTKRSFILTSVAMPVILLVIWVILGAVDVGPEDTPTLPAAQEQANTTIGYVDQADLVERVPENLSQDVLRGFPTMAEADAALRAEEIAAYYVIPPDYRESGQVRRVSERLPAMPGDETWIDWLIAVNLLPDRDIQQLVRLRYPFGASEPRYVTLGQKETGAQGGSFLPLIAVIVVMVPLFTSGGYLFQSLVEEKSNRIMEILLASLRPHHLFGGKVLGLSALTLVQYAIWAGLAFVAFQLTERDIGQALSAIDLSAPELVLVVPYALGGFLLYASLMAGIGALSSDTEGSRGWLFAISLPMTAPIYVWSIIASSPNGALATTLSLIPFSAPVTMLMRMVTTTVPVWQIALSLGLLILTCIGIIWLMARLFRVQTLLSGESPSLGRIWSALTS